MQECRLWVLEFLCDVPGEAEVWVLVDCAGNETGDIGRIAKNVRKGVGEGGGGLDGREVDLADVIADNEVKASRSSLNNNGQTNEGSRVGESERSLRLAACNLA